MGGKYSAEWWEKITDVNRETTARHDRSHLVDDLIQATANGKRSGPASLRNLGRNSPVSNLIFLNGLHAARGRLRRNVPVRAPSRTAARVFGAKTWANSVAYPTDNSRGCALNFCRFASGPFRHFATIAGCNAAASSDGGVGSWEASMCGEGRRRRAWRRRMRSAIGNVRGFSSCKPIIISNTPRRPRRSN